LHEVETLVVRDQGICAVLKQKINDVVVATPGCPEHWRRLYIAACGVDVGSGVD